MSLPTTSEILDVAGLAVAVFESQGLRCCLMGSVASYMYGVSREPNDADIVVLSSVNSQEELKQMLVRLNKQFFLVRSRNPRATYRVLWSRIPGTSKRCKVDILIPGILNVPAVPYRHIVMKRRDHHTLPVMPPIPQLLLKLQGWADHRASPRKDMRDKCHLDVRDVDSLLVKVDEMRLRIDSEDVQWVPKSLLTAATETLKKYVVVASPASIYDWRALGFTVTDRTAALRG
ncbi:hypothetical protein GY45DRAFT_1330534 [Cubamyces sp. BRFM 1775]|nr:hypothetical protein GY45DRAFT_1330534 [Cubamyces sp. BRFM 1775]